MIPQIIKTFLDSDIGYSFKKSKVAINKLKKLNPNIKLVSFLQRLNKRILTKLQKILKLL